MRVIQKGGMFFKKNKNLILLFVFNEIRNLCGRLLSVALTFHATCFLLINSLLYRWITSSEFVEGIARQIELSAYKSN